jgi:hypothetical protein
MDILNFISWIASKRRVVTSAPDDALVPIGIRTETRDDKYTTVAIKKSDLITIPEPTYKVYTALLTQTGTNPPVATILENNLGNITFGYNSAGNYTINSLSLFEVNKTFILSQAYSGYDNSISVVSTYINNSQISLSSINLGVANNNLIYTPTSIEIRVYN